MIDLQEIQKQDPIKRMVERQTEQEEFSPMDPPDAYSPPNSGVIPYEKMHPFLQELCDEHKKCIQQLDDFEKTLVKIQEEGVSKSIDEGLRTFFEFFDNNVVAHNKREEKHLFGFLHKRLLEKGEHSNGAIPTSGVSMMEEDHTEALQMAAVSFNFFALSARLPEMKSRIIVLDAAIEQGKALVELLRLHIFREENIIFPAAHEHLTSEELDEMSGQNKNKKD